MSLVDKMEIFGIKSWNNSAKELGGFLVTIICKDIFIRDS